MSIVTARPRHHQRSLFAGVLTAIVVAASAWGAVAAREPDRTAAPRSEAGHRLEPRAVRTTAAESVEILSAAAYLYDDGTVAVVSEARNLLTSRREGIVINVDFFNGTTFLGNLAEPVFLTRLAYGSTSPFLVFGDAPEGSEVGATTFEAAASTFGSAGVRFRRKSPPRRAI
jgi:hypothetical protein